MKKILKKLIIWALGDRIRVYQPMTPEENILYHNLGYDWDAELNKLHGEDLWDTPNENSRKVRKMVVDECVRIRDRIRELPWWRRLLNKF